MAAERDESKGGEGLFGLPDSMTASARLVLDAATGIARRRGHTMLGTEHILWALFNVEPPPTATKWMLKRVSKDAVLAALEAVPSFHATRASAGGSITSTPRFDAMVAAGIRVAGAVTADQFTSDSFLVGILVEGRNMAASILEDVSRGKVSCVAVLSSLHLDVEPYLAEHERIRSRSAPWAHSIITAAGVTHAPEGDPSAAAAGAATPSLAIPPLSDAGAIARLMPGPTEATNWLIPGVVLMGAMPRHREEVRGILNAGVTTITPLVESLSFKHEYPADIRKLLKSNSLSVGTKAVHILHFPIEDFECVDEPKHLVSIVEELVRRVRRGEVVFVHCLGGHGRTGTVVIPLLAALADMDNHTARKHVVAYHNQRARCRGSTWCHLPEVRSQEEQIHQVNPAMRREAHKNKAHK